MLETHVERDVALVVGGPLHGDVEPLRLPGLEHHLGAAHRDPTDVHRLGHRDGVEIDRIMSPPSSRHVDLLEGIGPAVDREARSVSPGHLGAPRDRDVPPSGRGVGGGLEPDAAVVAGGKDPPGDGRHPGGKAVDV